ncbi:MAG: DUF4249 domain-containing protein, partial [Bacteroidota bacterium]|nr:DUF4249 domain-containing protein [Bacteroidota bacterium]
LYVRDAKGRVGTGKTTIKKPVAIDTIKYVFNEGNSASANVFFTDPPGETFYSLYIIRNVNLTTVFTDKDFDGTKLPYQSPFVYKENENLQFHLLNVHRDYYDFITTFKMAYESNNRPITEPVRVKSNVSGAIGIFTGFLPVMVQSKVTR